MYTLLVCVYDVRTHVQKRWTLWHNGMTLPLLVVPLPSHPAPLGEYLC